MARIFTLSPKRDENFCIVFFFPLGSGGLIGWEILCYVIDVTCIMKMRRRGYILWETEYFEWMYIYIFVFCKSLVCRKNGERYRITLPERKWHRVFIFPHSFVQRKCVIYCLPKRASEITSGFLIYLSIYHTFFYIVIVWSRCDVTTPQFLFVNISLRSLFFIFVVKEKKKGFSLFSKYVAVRIPLPWFPSQSCYYYYWCKYRFIVSIITVNNKWLNKWIWMVFSVCFYLFGFPFWGS